ncbi:MAG: fumarylacetoacetate hydrolase family protein [Rhodospirillales bacterium]|nr:fumarylacetoacetate hydrolase family protein [Rhodospirillales bacterium]
MEAQRARQAANILWSAWQEKRLLEALPDDCRPQSLEEGYAIQDAMAAHHGGEVIGWKIAATSANGQRHIGVSEPLGGRLFTKFCHPDGARLPAGPLHMRVAEAEFAFRMARDLPPRATPYTTEEVMAAVGTLHLAIEVPDSRYRDFARVGAPQLVADDSCACYFVLGDEAAGWRRVDLAAHPVVGHKNGAVAERGSGANVLGDPRLALAWLANDRAARGDGLKAGQIVTTGTCIKPVPIAPGDQVVADFGALGRVRVQFS